MTPRQRLADARLYLLATTGLCRGPLIDTIMAAIAGGVDVVQLREKSLGDGEFLDLAVDIGSVVAQGGAIFLMNDRVAVAQATPGEGVHLGQEDLPLSLARDILGNDALIGISTHDRAQAREAESGGADYIGVGPAFATGTKDTGYKPLGPKKIAAIAGSVSIPAFAIGGITPKNLPKLHAAGVTRVAVSSAILGAKNPRKVARQLKKILDS